MPDAHTNFATSAVAAAGAPSPATSGTSLTVTTGTAALFPAVPFNAVVCPAGTQPTSTNAEIVRCTALATDTFTITRAQESSTARSIIATDQFYAAVTAKTLTDVEGDVALRALIASPTFTGTPAAPTAAVDTNTTQLATTAMVLAQAGSATPLCDTTTAVVGTSTRFARADHVHPTGGLLGTPLIVARTSDSAARNSGNTGNTLTADDTLLFAIAGVTGRTWMIEMFLLFTGATATMDAKASFTVPTSSSIIGGYGFVAGSAGFPGSPASASSYTVTAPFAAAGPWVWATGTAAAVFARGEAFLTESSTSGNVVLNWAQNVSPAEAGNLVLNKGSFLRVTRLV